MGFFDRILKPIRKVMDARSRAKVKIRNFKWGERPKTQSSLGADQSTYREIFKYEPFVRSTIGAAVDACIKSGWTWMPRWPDLENQSLRGKIKTVRNFFEHPEVQLPSFLRNLITNLLVYDDVYIEIAKDDGNAKGVYVLDTELMVVQRDENGTITGYLHRERQGDFETEFKPEEIVHISMNTMGSAFYGTSDLETIVRSANLYTYAKAYNERLFENAGIPTLAIIVKDAGKAEMDRIGDYLEDVQAGDNLLLSGDIDIKPISGFNKDLEYMGIFDTTRREMMVVMRVPTTAIALDVPTSQESARGALTTFGFRVNGIQQIVENAVDRIVLRLFGKYYQEVRFELHEWVDPFQQAQIDAIHLKWGVLTPNDVRKRLKMKPMPWGNVPYIPIQTLPGQRPGRPETVGDDGSRRDGSQTEEQADRENRRQDDPGWPT